MKSRDLRDYTGLTFHFPITKKGVLQETSPTLKGLESHLSSFVRFYKKSFKLRFTIKLGNIMPSLKKKNAAKKAKHEAKTGK